MEDQKMSDKRKAPDKNASSEDLSDVSVIIQTPLKRPRMEIHSEESENDPFAFPGDEAVSLPQIDEGADLLFEEAEINSQLLAKTEHVSSEENGKHDSKEELGILDGENESENHTGIFLKDAVEIEIEEIEHKIDPMEDNNNEEEPLEKQNLASHIRTGKSNSQPTATSSPLSEVDSQGIINPSMEIEIMIRACDPNTRRSIFEETLKSDYGRLDTFLKLHNVILTNSSLEGYLADVSSQENSAPSSYRHRNRWTSSTLGSVIPRESIRTIETISPNESPTDNPAKKADRSSSITSNKKRGRNEPKMTSTKLSDFSSGTATSSSGKLERMKVSAIVNGDDISNGPMSSVSSASAKSSSDKSKKLSLKEESFGSEEFTPDSKGSKSKSGRKATPAKGSSFEEKAGSAIKKGGRTPRLGIREFSGVNSSLLTPTAPVDPSPVRIIAKIEGTMAKPTTKFEAEVNNEPVDKGSLSKSSTLWGSIGPSELVFARWRDKNYYSGVVKQKGLNDTWIIDYDDGMEDVASETHIVPIKILGVGIQGVYSPDGCFKPGDAIVLGQKFVDDPEVGPTVKYAIQLEGENKPIWCTRRQLSIKEMDARTLRQEFMPMPKILKAAEVSLENIVSGPRRRVAASSSKSTVKVVGGAFDVSVAEDTNRESKSTPKIRAGKGRRKLSESSSVSDISKTSAADVSGPSKVSILEKKAPAVGKDSPKKYKAKEESSVFEGYQFFLTASGGGDPAAETGSPIPVIPYDKDEYRDLIETQGGKVIDSVGNEKGNDKIFLVSDNYARTVKYIYCLAGSIPCVSHKWVQKCLDEKCVVEWKTFELNSGWSLEQKRLIPSHRQKPLKGFKIYITAGSDDLYNYWKPVLTAAQATLLKPKKPKGKNDREPGIPAQAQVLVTDATCSPEVLNDAIVKKIPVVKPEWLVQTIITGQKADFVGDEKYQVEEVDPDEYEADDDEEEEEDQ